MDGEMQLMAIPWPLTWTGENAFYPMTNVKISGEMGCWEMRDFPIPSDPHAHGSWDIHKNPYPLRNCIIPNLATVGAPGTKRPVASWFPGPDSFLIGNYVISQWAWLLAILTFGHYNRLQHSKC